MPNSRSKRIIPSRQCQVCDRPFEWRKAWERDWPHVKYCSDRCRRAARRKIATVIDGHSASGKK